MGRLANPDDEDMVGAVLVALVALIMLGAVGDLGSVSDMDGSTM